MSKKRISGFGERIRRARRKLGWTQERLAQFLDYSSHRIVSKIENGETSAEEDVLKWTKGVLRIRADEGRKLYGGDVKLKRRYSFRKTHKEENPRGKNNNEKNTSKRLESQQIGANSRGDFNENGLFESSICKSKEENQGEEKNWTRKPIERHKPSKYAGRKREIFKCSFCGSCTQIDGYYENLRETLVSRHVEVAKENLNGDYFHTMLKCIRATFGKDRVVFNALKKEGFCPDVLGAVEEDIEGNGNHTCIYCGNKPKKKDHQSDLKETAILNFIKLLKQDVSDRNAIDAVFDSIAAFSQIQGKLKEALIRARFPDSILSHVKKEDFEDSILSVGNTIGN